MKIVAAMIVRDEDDIIGETITEILKYTSDIVVLDGGSVDRTIDIIRSFPEVRLTQVFSGSNWDHAGERELLLNLARDLSADWVITVDADEIYHTDPIEAIEIAEKERATIIRCNIPQFYFTEKELLDGVLQTEDTIVSIQERRRYYSWGWTDCMIFKMQHGLTYLGGKDGRITRPPYFTDNAVRIEASVRPILKHYQYRSLQQYAKKMKNRRRDCGDNYKRWFRWTYENPFFNEEKLIYFDGIFKNESNDDVLFIK